MPDDLKKRATSAARVFSDLNRLTDLLMDADPVATGETVALIIEAMSILQHHSLIGRPVDDNLRELLIARGRTGHVALYDYAAEHDAVLILAIRHQREAGFSQQAARLCHADRCIH